MPVKQEVVDTEYENLFGVQVDEVGGSGQNVSLCQVCGDVAAGFHCGAFVCEACKVKHYDILFSCIYLFLFIALIYVETEKKK